MAASCSAGLRGEGKGKAGHCAAVRARGAPRGRPECGTSAPQGCGHSQRPAAPPKTGHFGSASPLCLGQSFTVPSFLFLYYFILFCLFIFASLPPFFCFYFIFFSSLFSSSLYFFPPPVPGQGGAAQPGPGRFSADRRAGRGEGCGPPAAVRPHAALPTCFSAPAFGESCRIAAGSRWSPGAGDCGPRRAPRPFLPGENRGRRRAGPGAGGEAAGRGQGRRAGPGLAFALSLPLTSPRRAAVPSLPRARPTTTRRAWPGPWGTTRTRRRSAPTPTGTPRTARTRRGTPRPPSRPG